MEKLQVRDSFSPVVRQKLGYYVYVYINPLDNIVFYVGKGKGDRAFAHLDSTEFQKVKIIADLQKMGLKPRIEILAHGLKPETALKVEAAVIDLLGKDNLTNKVGGYHAKSHGRMTIDQICAIYDADRVDIVEPALLIRINRLYRHTMTEHELYETTRGYWKVNPTKKKVELAMAVYEGVVREVYKIVEWFPAGATFVGIPGRKAPNPKRYEFVGRIADEPIRSKYRNGSVSHYFTNSSQNPIKYVNVKST